MEPDEALLARWRAGDEGAGNALFDRHFDALYAFFAGKVRGEPDDLIQRTLLACVAARDRFRGEASFRTWLFRIARNELYQYWRKKKVGDAGDDPGSLSLQDLGTTPSVAVVRRQEARLLLAALRSLVLEQQLLLELFYWEELTAGELAAVFEVPEGTIRSRLKAARDRLEAALARLSSSVALLESTTSDLERWARSLRGLHRAREG